MEDPVVPLERNLYGHLSAGLLWERQFEKVLLEHGWEKFKIVNAYSLTKKNTILIHTCERYQINKQDKKHRTDLENSHGRR